MKLKLLFAPLLVLLIIVMAIWVVAPAYQELQVQKDELATAQQKLTDIQEKNALAAKLRQELAGNAEQEGLLLKYIPREAQEEIIIENLNSLALEEGLLVNNISVTGNTGKSIPVVVVSDGMDAQAVPVLSENKISLNTGVIGPYEKIKSFIGKLAALKRYNNISSLKISPAASGTSANKLQADMMINFAYFSDNNAAVNVNSSIFSKGSFDKTVIEQIKNRLNKDVVPVNIGETGKANPFLP